MTFELHTFTRPYFPSLINYLDPVLALLARHPPLLPFQLLVLARKVLLTVFIALAQLGPLLKQDPVATARSTNGNNPEVTRLRMLDHLDQLSQVADTETTRLLALEMSPFATTNQHPNLLDLKSHIRDSLVQARIQAQPEVHRAFRAAMTRQGTAMKESTNAGREGEQ